VASVGQVQGRRGPTRARAQNADIVGNHKFRRR
jgi:hypothetical protein